jgi:3-isopropylmalate dehydrogenase
MTKAAELIEAAIERTLKQGKRTVDIHSEGCELVSTQQLTDAILTNFEEVYNE